MSAEGKPVVYDGILRYLVPSRRNHADKYLVELDAYQGNGRCCCKDFACRREPLLKRGMTAAAAVDQGLIKLKDGRPTYHALRCEHLITARDQFCDDVIQAMTTTDAET